MRFFTPTFRISVPTCFFTVARSMPSSSAMTRLGCPSTSSFSTCASRFVNFGSLADLALLSSADDSSSQPRVLEPHLNNPADDQGLFYFQSAWDGKENAPPEKRFSVIGVGNRPGVYAMIAGAILIAIGIGYAFYVKPLLLKSKKEFLANWAAAQRLGLKRTSFPRDGVPQRLRDALGTVEPVGLAKDATIWLGGRVFRNQIILVANVKVFKYLEMDEKPAAIIGSGLLKDNSLAIDFARQRLYVGPARAGEPTEPPPFGVVVP